MKIEDDYWRFEGTDEEKRELVLTLMGIPKHLQKPPKPVNFTFRQRIKLAWTILFHGSFNQQK